MTGLKLLLAATSVLCLTATGHAAHTKAQIQAAKTFTVAGIGFRDRQTRARKTFTDKFPDSVQGSGGQINDSGKQHYRTKLEGGRTLEARYHNGVLYELVLIHPRQQTSYAALAKKYGPPDTTAGGNRSFVWRLDNMKISLNYTSSAEQVSYFDTKYREAAQQATAAKGRSSVNAGR